MDTHKTLLGLAILLLLLVFPRPVASKPSDSIVVNNADTVRQASVSVSQDLLDLTEQQPFGALQHGPRSYLLVTFGKYTLDVEFELPHRPEGSPYRVVGATGRELFTVTDTTTGQTPDVMRWIERQHGRQLTSRTWLTVGRILKRMG